jgi:hypothetical protein
LLIPRRLVEFYPKLATDECAVAARFAVEDFVFEPRMLDLLFLRTLDVLSERHKVLAVVVVWGM